MAYFNRASATASPVLTPPPLSSLPPTNFDAFTRMPSASVGASRASASRALLAGSKRSSDEVLGTRYSSGGQGGGSVHLSAADCSQGVEIRSVGAGFLSRAGLGLACGAIDRIQPAGDPRRRDDAYADDDDDGESRCRKAQRVSSTLQQPTQAQLVGSSTGGDSAAPADVRGPVVDHFTRQLGIGWRRISDDEHIQAASRGWARFIQNKFALDNVRICLESKGLQSFLVEAAQGFFLFAEDLRRGRLVSPTIEGALRNLQQSPPVFDGEEVTMEA